MTNCLLLLISLSVVTAGQGQSVSFCTNLTLLNGRISYNHTNGSADIRAEGTDATYSCDIGYTLNGGSTTRTCQSDGSWSGSAPTCEAVWCGRSPFVSHGFHKTQTGSTFGKIATYDCEAGYVLAGSATVTCEASGNWSTPPSCHLPPVYLSLGSTNYVLSNSQVAIDSIRESNDQALLCRTNSPECCRAQENSGGLSGLGDWLFPNKTVIKTRKSDLTESDSDLFFLSRYRQQIRLHHRGNISMPTGSYCCMVPVASQEDMVSFCADLVEKVAPATPASCGSPPPIENGHFETLTSTEIGGVVTYRCDSGYIHAGSLVVSCQATGNWSTLPSCQVPPPVYLSLSSTNYISDTSYTRPPKIPLSSVGEGRGNSLVCHTDSTTCCRQSRGEGDLGEWHNPNGSVVGRNSERDGLYMTRDRMSVSLNRRNGTAAIPGLYCCFMPTSAGNDKVCAVLVLETPPSSQPADITVGIVGGALGVLAGILVILIVSLVIVILCLVSRRKSDKKVEDNCTCVPNDPLPALPEIEQISSPLYDSISQTYSEISSHSSVEAKDEYDCTLNVSYMTAQGGVATKGELYTLNVSYMTAQGGVATKGELNRDNAL